MPCRGRDIIVRGRRRLCVISRRCCCAYRQSGSDTMLRSRQFTMRCRRFRELCVGQQVRCAKRVVNGGREGLTPLHAAGARACHMCPHGTAVMVHKHTRFSSCDARRNLTQAAKSGVRLLFLRSKDRRSLEDASHLCFVNGAACNRPEILPLRPAVSPIWCCECSCTLHPAYVDFDHPLG
jgi:hypothetical protein